MNLRQPRPFAEQLLAQGPRRVLGLVDPTLLQLRHQQFHGVDKGFVRQCIGQVETVDIGLLNPLLQQIGHRFGTADKQRTKPANPDPVGQFVGRPDLVRISRGERLHRRLDGVGVHMFERLIRLELTEIDPGPARNQCHRAFVTDPGFVFLELGLGLGVGLAEDHGLQVEDQDLLRIAPRFRRTTADVGHGLFQQHFRRCRHEHAFGMFGGKLLAATRCAGLIQHGRALRRRFAKVNARHLEVFADVLDFVDFARIAEDPALAIAQDCTLLPTAFPEFVANLQVLFGEVVASVVFRLVFLPEVLRTAFQVRGHDVPTRAALGQVIEGRQTTGKRIRVFKRQRRGQAEPQMLGDQRHRRNQLQWVIDRHLRRLADRCVTVAVVDVVDAQHVGDEQPVEFAAFEDFRQIGPVLEVFVLPRAVPWVRP